MSALERQVVVSRGVKFYDDGDKLMWVRSIDGSTRFGPREATDQDLIDWPLEFSQYQEGYEPEINPNMERLIEPEGGPPPSEEGPYAKRRRAAAKE